MWKALVVAILVAVSAPAFAQQDDEGSFAGRFVRDVGSDYQHFFSVENAEWLGFGGAAALVMHAGDDTIHQWVVDNNPSSLSGGHEYGSQYVQIPLAIAWWGIGAATGSDRNAAVGRDLLRAQLSVVSWTYAIKLATNRTRPNGDPRSFPSGHASNSFATAMVLQEHFGWKLGVPAFLAATYTGVSRVIDNQHWASDVVFGAFLGIASGRTVTLHMRDSRVTFAPLSVPGGGGVMVSVTR
ncbi:MAG TPA: phosphatase PAP2 family protein [Vicinamibacterales bacterium]|nr:phosphatase PAP2 family protein [Vicinamibacterales bacterium]